jgi:hypothetical protein
VLSAIEKPASSWPESPATLPEASWVHNRLNEQFLQEFYGAWEQHGVEALRRTAIEEPAAFVRVAASLLPKELTVDTTAADCTLRISHGGRSKSKDHGTCSMREVTPE